MPKRKPLALGAAMLLGVMPAAAQTPGPAEALVLAERAVVEAVARDGIAATMYNVLAPGGVLLWPGAPAVTGPDSARLLLVNQPALDSLRISWQPLGVELSSDGRLGVSWGIALAIPPSRSPRIGRYIAVWSKSGDAWKLAAFVPIGLLPVAATMIPPELAGVRYAPLAPGGAVTAFIAADLAFARRAGDSGAFEHYAAPTAVTLGPVLLNRGPEAIGRALRSSPPAHWAWHPILAGASADLGFTVGESTITPESGAVSYGKYLTIWRRLPRGEIRFLTDGGNARPATP